MSGRPTGLRVGSSAADQIAVRRHNLSLVLSHLRDHGPRSRARLADETGLNKGTVSSLVAELAGRGLAEEGETERGAVGRPGQAIELDGVHVVAVGAEINIDYLAILCLNLRGNTVAERRLALDTAHMEPALVLGRLARLLETVLRDLERRGIRPVGMTIAVPGLIEFATGIVRVAPNLGWRNIPVADEIVRLLRQPAYPVLLDNEANLAALAELQVTGGKLSDLILVTGAAGVGGGIVTGGQLLRGTAGFAGEVGHMRVRSGGPLCGCGRRGCWEAAVSLNALLRAAASGDDPVRDPSLDVEQRLAELSSRAGAGDQRVRAAIAEVDHWLAVGAGILVNILNPQQLVLGGYFAALSPWIAATLQEDLGDHLVAKDAVGTHVSFSTLGFSASARGGASQILDRVFQDPTIVEPPEAKQPVARKESE